MSHNSNSLFSTSDAQGPFRRFIALATCSSYKQIILDNGAAGPLVEDLFGVKDLLQIGMLAAIPYGVTTVGMIAIGYHSDRTLERRWHCAIPAFVGALGLIGLNAANGNIVASFVCLSVASTGIITTPSARQASHNGKTSQVMPIASTIRSPIRIPSA